VEAGVQGGGGVREGKDGTGEEGSMIPTVVTIEELKAQLQEMGYRFAEQSEDYSTYWIETTTVDLAPYLPMERIRQGLSEFGPMVVDGWYVVAVQVENGVVTWLDYTFCYEIQAKRKEITAKLDFLGNMDAPFPEGRPTRYVLDTTLFVGPLAMEKEQEAEIKRLVKETLASIPAFVQVFPEARVFAVLETRGGCGGWKRKEAWHVVGRVRELVRGREAA
jgi:hypothetical protein